MEPGAKNKVTRRADFVTKSLSIMEQKIWFNHFSIIEKLLICLL